MEPGLNPDHVALELVTTILYRAGKSSSCGKRDADCCCCYNSFINSKDCHNATVNVCLPTPVYCTFKVKLNLNSAGSTHAHKTGITEDPLKILNYHILNS